MMNRQLRVKNVLVQLNALLHVMQWKFNPCKREIVCLMYSYSADKICISDMFSCIALTGLLNIKTLNDFTVYLRNMI